MTLDVVSQDGPVDAAGQRLERRRVLTENVMHAVDELLSELKRSNRGLHCSLHRAERLPTLCPVCALVECRVRMRGHPDYRSAV